MAKLRFKAVPDPECCCWCGKRLKKDDVGGVVSAISRHDLEPKGKWVQVKLLSEEKIIGIVTEEGSEAKRVGFDIVFLICSRECHHALRVALAQSGELL